jgi:hypothetical protein
VVNDGSGHFCDESGPEPWNRVGGVAAPPESHRGRFYQLEPIPSRFDTLLARCGGACRAGGGEFDALPAARPSVLS